MSRQPKAMFLADLFHSGQYDNATAIRAAHELARQHALIQQMAEALESVCKWFPSDDDMERAGWDPQEVNAACGAYDKARAALRAYKESQ